MVGGERFRLDGVIDGGCAVFCGPETRVWGDCVTDVALGLRTQDSFSSDGMPLEINLKSA